MATETVQQPKADPAPAEASTALPADTLTKCEPIQESTSMKLTLTASIRRTDKTAAEIAAKALQHVISKAVKGSNLLELCREGDKSIEDACALVYNKDKKNPTQKGVAFPCTLSINK
jgi:hypothetical protein